MRMKRVLVAGLIAALVGCGDIQGNGDIVEQDRSIEAFSGVALAGGLHGDISVGPEASVKIRGDSNLLDYIRLVLKEGVLTSELDTGLSLMPSEPIVAIVVTPTLTEVRASSGAHLLARGINAENLTLRVSGRSELEISGAARKLTLEAALSSQVLAGELIVEQATIDVSGSSDVILHVTQQVSGAASGGSDVLIRGNPPQSAIVTSGGSQVLFE